MKSKSACRLTTSSDPIGVPYYLIPKLSGILSELGYTVRTTDSIITIEW